MIRKTDNIPNQKSSDKGVSDRAAGDFLDGQILIAMPNMQDSRFAGALVFLCKHSQQGAMGLIINKTYPELSFLEVTSQLDLLEEDMQYDVPEKTLYYGGPVDPGRGFVLHSPDFDLDSFTQSLSDTLSLTANIDIIEAIAKGKGPKDSLIALGYAGWSAGQLEDELKDNGWLHCPATTDLIFLEQADEKYDMALQSLGISKDFLSADAGHA